MHRDVPDIDPNLLPVVRKVLKTFSVMSYGDFDEFDELKNLTELPKLNHLNLTELLLKVNHTKLFHMFSKSCLKLHIHIIIIIPCCVVFFYVLMRNQQNEKFITHLILLNKLLYRHNARYSFNLGLYTNMLLCYIY